MSENRLEQAKPPSDRQLALERWDDEGGAGPDGPQERSQINLAKADGGASVEMEIARLRVRVIALENLIIALLAEASPRQLGLIRDMAVFITPRPGTTPHPLTTQAARQMVSLVERSGHFRQAGHDVG